MIDIYKYFDKIYYINLHNDQNKKKYFEREIQKSNLLSKKCQRYEAVFGESLDIRIIPNHIISEAAKKDIQQTNQRTYGISLTYGSAACALSHYLIYEECAKAKSPYMIFEDDIIISESFENNLTKIINDIVEEKLEDYDIIYLGYNQIPGFHKKILNNNISRPKGLITGLYGYIVSNTGAQKLLKNVFPLEQQIDSSISNNIDKFSLFCSTQKIVGVRTDFGSKTQSQASCQNIHNYKFALDDEWEKLFT